MNRRLRRQLLASKDGAAVAAALYILAIIWLTWADQPLYELPTWQYKILLPATFLPGLASTETLWLGIPLSTLLLSATIWIAVGYLADWLYHPND